MQIQPKLLTVIIANEDLAKCYTTIRSVQQTRYRNHEIVAVVPSYLQPICKRLRQDFNWLPIITDPVASLSTLMQIAIERAQYSHVDAICFVQAGTHLETAFLSQFTMYLRNHPKIGLFMPAVMRPEGRVVFGADQKGQWPHHLQAIPTPPADNADIMGTHLLGPVCLIRLESCSKQAFSELNDDLALLYWTEKMIAHGLKTLSATTLTVFYDGTLYSDLTESVVVPSRWYSDVERYISTYGKWYDKVGFFIRYRWRREGGVFSKLIDYWLTDNHAYKLP